MLSDVCKGIVFPSDMQEIPGRTFRPGIPTTILFLFFPGEDSLFLATAVVFQ